MKKINEITKGLKSAGWQFIDMSGDGGLFGYHVKSEPEFKSFILGLSRGTNGTMVDDFIYPADGWADEANVPVCMGVYILDETPPTTDDPDALDIFCREKLHEPAHEFFFTNVRAAVEFAGFLEVLPYHTTQQAIEASTT